MNGVKIIACRVARNYDCGVIMRFKGMTRAEGHTHEHLQWWIQCPTLELDPLTAASIFIVTSPACHRPCTAFFFFYKKQVGSTFFLLLFFFFSCGLFTDMPWLGLARLEYRQDIFSIGRMRNMYFDLKPIHGLQVGRCLAWHGLAQIRGLGWEFEASG